jgi:DNA polymerase III subunit delta'
VIQHIAGHDEAVAALNRALAAGRPAHAYLFAGPPAIGKALLARALARTFTCRGANPVCDPNQPETLCSPCRRIEAGKHPDVQLLSQTSTCTVSEHDHAAEFSRDIRICQVRQAEHWLGIAPFEGGRRVLIVDPADAMNAQAADAFLKTLEEPPNGALIVLVSANEGGLSETVRSRCRRLLLRPLPAALTERVLRDRIAADPALREQTADPAARATGLTRLVGGQVGLAVRALSEPEFESRRTALLDAAAAVARAGLAERFQAADRLADAYGRRERTAAEDGGSLPAEGRARTRAEVFATLDVWTEWWRDLLLVASGAEALAVNAGRLAELRELALLMGGAEGALAGLEAVRDSRRDLTHNVQARLALEAMMLRLPPSRPAEARAAAPGRTGGMERPRAR